MFKRFLGVVALATGVFMTCWIGYNLFIHRMPQTEGLPVTGPIVMTVACYYVGWKWLCGIPVESPRPADKLKASDSRRSE